MRTRRSFKLVTGFEPQGDQPAAIDSLCRGPRGRSTPPGAARRHRLAARPSRWRTSSPQVNRPTLVIAPNKTLAAQLYHEFQALFPDNAVRYFVSYYDYYQPEAYVPSHRHVHREGRVDQRRDRQDAPLGHARRCSSATTCIDRRERLLHLRPRLAGSVLRHAGLPRARRRGRPRRAAAQARRHPVRAQRLRLPPRHVPRARRRGRDLPGLRGGARAAHRVLRRRDRGDRRDRSAARQGRCAGSSAVAIYPASHYVDDQADDSKRAVDGIRAELEERLAELRAAKPSCSRRSASSSARCYDLELLAEMGFCPGIENYSRHLDGRAPGRAAAHAARLLSRRTSCCSSTRATSPCRRSAACTAATASRKETLVEFGFRLPSALDNRPLNFEEFEARIGQVVYVSATPGDCELERAARAWSSSSSSARPA